MQNQENTLSIAVLPFRNISQDTDNDYFCDGMSEEIIIALSRVQGRVLKFWKVKIFLQCQYLNIRS